jgi:peptide deformylase
MKYNRYVSEIIQHEIDHLNGVLIWIYFSMITYYVIYP